jgi:excisionase family DNA binding protein
VICVTEVLMRVWLYKGKIVRKRSKKKRSKGRSLNIIILLNGMDMMEDRWLSSVEIADYLIIKRETVYDWIGKRNLPAHKSGNIWKFREKEFLEWVHATGSRDCVVKTSKTDMPIRKIIRGFPRSLTVRIIKQDS